MSKHTPGPWQAEWTHRQGYDEAGIHGWHVFAPADKTEAVICDIPDDGLNRKGNARLIAAAPDLLAACKALVKVRDIQRQREAEELHLTAEAMMHLWDEANDGAIAAIAKAEGGAQ